MGETALKLARNATYHDALCAATPPWPRASLTARSRNITDRRRGWGCAVILSLCHFLPRWRGIRPLGARAPRPDGSGAVRLGRHRTSRHRPVLGVDRGTPRRTAGPRSPGGHTCAPSPKITLQRPRRPLWFVCVRGCARWRSWSAAILLRPVTATSAFAGLQQADSIERTPAHLRPQAAAEDRGFLHVQCDRRRSPHPLATLGRTSDLTRPRRAQGHAGPWR